jgi:hypothetical protein
MRIFGVTVVKERRDALTGREWLKKFLSSELLSTAREEWPIQNSEYEG